MPNHTYSNTNLYSADTLSASVDGFDKKSVPFQPDDVVLSLYVNNAGFPTWPHGGVCVTSRAPGQSDGVSGDTHLRTSTGAGLHSHMVQCTCTESDALKRDVYMSVVFPDTVYINLDNMSTKPK